MFYDNGNYKLLLIIPCHNWKYGIEYFYSHNFGENQNKCIGDDTKAAARQSLNCIKTTKIKYGEKPFSIWRMELLHPAMWHDHELISPGDCTLQCGMWLWHRDSESTKWQHTAIWHMAQGWHAIEFPKRPTYWNFTFDFDFDHITAVDMSFSISLRNFIQIGPPSAEK